MANWTRNIKLLWIYKSKRSHFIGNLPKILAWIFLSRYSLWHLISQMAAASFATLCFLSQNPAKTLHFSLPKLPLTIPKPSVHSITNFSPSFPRFLSSKVVPRHSSNHISCNSASTFPVSTKNYEVLASNHPIYRLFGCLEDLGRDKEFLLFCLCFLLGMAEYNYVLLIDSSLFFHIQIM